MARHARLAPFFAAVLLAGCGASSPPVADFPEVPFRGTRVGAAPLRFEIDPAPQGRYAGVALLGRGAPATCLAEVPIVLEAEGGARFRVLTASPDFLVTRETEVRQGWDSFGPGMMPAAGPGPGLEPGFGLLVTGVNNGRCDYAVRVARQG